MSLTRLRTFIEVYRKGSISAAARSLNLTQPAVSQHISGLEVAVGRPLFERTPQGVEPTSIANELAFDIGDKLDSAEEALLSARARSMDIAGVLQIVGHADFLAEVMSDKLLPLLNDGIKIRLHTGNASLVTSMLLEGHCDLGISAHPVIDAQLKSEKIYTTRVLAVASPHVADRIVNAHSLSSALHQIPMLAYNLELTLIQNWMKKNQIAIENFTPSLVSQDLRTQKKLLIQGFGWSVMPEFLCHQELQSGELQEVQAPCGVPEISYYLIWMAGGASTIRVVHARQKLLQTFRHSEP